VSDLTDLSAFKPTHVIPDSGLGAWNEPDGQQPVAAWVEPGTEVRVDEWRGAWAHASFVNGWVAWLDGRQLRPCTPVVTPPPPPPPPPPAPAPPVWQPTNVVGPAGLPAWADPDATQQPAARIDPGVEVAVTERLDNGWANVACSNGWTAWVDGRQLLPLGSGGASPFAAPGVPAAAPTSPPPSVARTAFGITVPSWWPAEIPFIAGGAAALILIGSFLPWLTFGPFSASGWDLNFGYLITGSGVTGGLKVGFVLLGAVVIGLPALTHKPLPPWVVPAVGGVAVALPAITLLRALTAGHGVSQGLSTGLSLSPSVGLFLTLAAGVVILVDWGRERGLGAAPH
jgi:hypothetical protein